jgi:hypothetical protein
MKQPSNLCQAKLYVGDMFLPAGGGSLRKNMRPSARETNPYSSPDSFGGDGGEKNPRNGHFRQFGLFLATAEIAKENT